MRSTFILLLCCMCFACAKYPGVPEKYHALLDKEMIFKEEDLRNSWYQVYDVFLSRWLQLTF